MTVKIIKLALDTKAKYRIQVQGPIPNIKPYWQNMQIETRLTKDNNLMISIVISYFDQAGLLGFLRHLYAMGIPLIEVVCLECTDRIFI